jgi:cytochrome oxidase assembly protein ShyY1
LGVYRFLLTPRWLGFAALMLALSAVMVGLGLWQLERYDERSATNARIEAAGRAEPVPVGQVVTVGHAPPVAAAWTRVSATGRYDTAHQVLARDRSQDGSAGYEVLTPLVLTDGSAVLVDRGWLPPGQRGALTAPAVPAPPGGDVTVVGRVHLAESRSDAPLVVDGVTQVRRIDPVRLAGAVPYPLADGYVLLDEQRPVANDKAFTGIPVGHENAAMNAGYVVQWWAFALITLIGFGWVAYRHAHEADELDFATLDGDLPEAPVSPRI